jgi:hypothetical protein
VSLERSFLRYFCRISNPHIRFLKFNGNIVTIGRAQERSVKQPNNARSRCQLWNLMLSTTVVDFVADACGTEEHG